MPSHTSLRLCGGMLVAMPTAMPAAPFTSRLGTRVGITVGSSKRVVEVGPHVHRLLVQVREHLFGDLPHAGLGVAHGRRAGPRRCCRSCPGHPPADSAGSTPGPCAPWRRTRCCRRADGTCPAPPPRYGRSSCRAAVAQHAQVLHAVQHPAVHRLQTVAHVGQGPAHDHRHRIIDVGGAHFVLDVDRDDLLSPSAMVLFLWWPWHGPCRPPQKGARKYPECPIRMNPGIFHITTG
jgi:hypothetical protein